MSRFLISVMIAVFIVFAMTVLFGFTNLGADAALWVKLRTASGLELVDYACGRWGESALPELLRRGYDSETVQECRNRSESPFVRVRVPANLVLFEMRDEPERRLESLLRSLDMHDPFAMQANSLIVPFIGPEDSEFAGQVLEYYRGADREGQFLVTGVLANMWRSSGVREFFIHSKIGSPVAHDRAVAAMFISEAGREDQSSRGSWELIEAGISLLSDQSEEVRKAAAEALGVHGANNVTAIDALRSALLQDESPEVRLESLKALAHIVPDQCMLGIARTAMSDGSQELRREAGLITSRLYAHRALHVGYYVLPLVLGLAACISIIKLKRKTARRSALSPHSSHE